MTGSERETEPNPQQPSPKQKPKDEPRHRRAGDEDRPVLPRGSESERDEAWGDRSRSAERDADWYREQRPPHYE